MLIQMARRIENRSDPLPDQKNIRNLFALSFPQNITSAIGYAIDGKIYREVE